MGETGGNVHAGNEKPVRGESRRDSRDDSAPTPQRRLGVERRKDAKIRERASECFSYFSPV